jgi:photosystem II stability/assembly factor-like uncharacterized protein
VKILPSFWRVASIASLLSGLAPAFAAGPSHQPYLWRNVKIGGGGFVSGIVFHPAQRGLVYVRTDVGGAYRWNQEDRSWIPLNDMLGRENATHLGVLSLAVDPNNANLLYLACGQYTQAWEKNHAALLWSRDQGATWSHTVLPFKLGGNEDGRSTGERLQVDPHDDGILILGTNHDGLWMSTGHQLGIWRQVAGFPAASVTFVLFDQRSGQPGNPTPILYVGTNSLETNLYRSTDGGKTWAIVPGQPTGMIPHHAGLDAAGMLYLTYGNHLGPNGLTDGSVWKFNPAAGTWITITPVKPAGDDKFGYAGLALDARRPGTLMVTTLDRWHVGDEIFRSTDGGATWTGLRAKATWNHSSAPYTAKLEPHWMGDIDIDPCDSSHAIVVTGYGIWTCDNLTAADSGGATHWTFGDDGLEEAVPSALASPPVGAPLVSSFYDIAGFRHDNLDVSPPQGAFDSTFRNCYSIDFAEKKPAQLVLTHAGGAQRGSYSLDGGTTWTSFASSPHPALANGPGAIAIAADGSRLVWLPTGAPPFYSTDNGITWSPSRRGPTAVNDHRITRPTADRENPRIFYIYDLAKGRLWVSTDGGATFDRAAPKLPVEGGVLACVPGREGDLWLPAPTGLYRSVNSGAKFTRLASVQAAYQVGFGRPAPGRDYPVIYLAGKVDDEEGVFRSDDAGQSWVAITDNRHRFGWISAVIGDPRTYGRVYLGTGGRGIIYGDPEPGAP